MAEPQQVIVKTGGFWRMFCGCLAALAVAAVILPIMGIGTCGYLAKVGRDEMDRQESEGRERAKHLPVSDLTFENVDQTFTNNNSKVTDLQRKALWPKYVGKKVCWSGEVHSVRDSLGALILEVKHNASTLTSDVYVKLMPDQAQNAIRLKEGKHVAYCGVLADYDALRGIVLKNGEVKN